MGMFDYLIMPHLRVLRRRSAMARSETAFKISSGISSINVRNEQQIRIQAETSLNPIFPNVGISF